MKKKMTLLALCALEKKGDVYGISYLHDAAERKQENPEMKTSKKCVSFKCVSF